MGGCKYVCETKVIRRALLKALVAPAHQHGVHLDKVAEQWGCQLYSVHEGQFSCWHKSHFSRWYSFFIWQLMRDFEFSGGR